MVTQLPRFDPMEAKLVATLPDEPGWQFGPKWDGFRCIVYRDGDNVDLQSKSGKPLARYFPEVVAIVRGLRATRFILDAELIIRLGDGLSFDALQARLHPAESRIHKLAVETPASLIAFDWLHDATRSLADEPLSMRRDALDAFAANEDAPSLMLSPRTRNLPNATEWLARSGGALDGVVAKRLDDRYRAGERAMLKAKQIRTADCVVGGYRNAAGSDAIGSLLLGLYNADGLLDHVGFTSAIKASDQAALAERLRPHVGGTSFTGKAPGAPSRWSTGRSSQWTPIAPELVVEVGYDQVTANRFRHGTALHRWRPDKAPRQCTTDQLVHELRPAELQTL